MPVVARLLPIAAIAVWVFLGAAPALADDVDLELVLAVDVSRSIDDGEYDLQRKGYAAALSDPRVLKTILSGQNGRIALCYFEWSGEVSQQVIVDWTVIKDVDSAARVATQLASAPRPFANRTSLGVAIDYATSLFGHSPHRSTRRVIDVSGDGANTNGLEPAAARDIAVAQGITINGLVIINQNEMPWMPWHTHPPGGLDTYYRNNVAGGTGAFVIKVENFETFSTAIIDKLVREIARADDRPPYAAQAAALPPETKYPAGNAFTVVAHPRM